MANELQKELFKIAGGVIKERRIEAGLSIDEVAKKSKATIELIENLEAGEQHNKVEEFLRVMKAINFSEFDLREKIERIWYSIHEESILDVAFGRIKTKEKPPEQYIRKRENEASPLSLESKC